MCEVRRRPGEQHQHSICSGRRKGESGRDSHGIAHTAEDINMMTHRNMPGRTPWTLLDWKLRTRACDVLVSVLVPLPDAVILVVEGTHNIHMMERIQLDAGIPEGTTSNLRQNTA